MQLWIASRIAGSVLAAVQCNSCNQPFLLVSHYVIFFMPMMPLYLDTVATLDTGGLSSGAKVIVKELNIRIL